MNYHVGTSGFSYREWIPGFYPEKTAPGDMLRLYAERLPAVEINNTFYRMPKRSVLATWLEQVPQDFRFAIKASRRITHFKRLKEPQDELFYLFRSLDTMGDRLGCVLYQTPPYLKKDLPRLTAFLDLLPEGSRGAFDFHHDTWVDEETAELLAARGHALCRVDSADTADREVSVPALGDWGYLRLRRPGYDAALLADWARAIAATGWKDVFVFFKHEDDGAGPALAGRFLEQARRS